MLDYIALALLFFVAFIMFYGIIAIHDIPYEMAKHRNHPHQDAIHVAGWVSLFTLHVLWPFLWIWASLFKPGVGWGMTGHGQESDSSDLENTIQALQDRIDGLEKKLEEKSENKANNTPEEQQQEISENNPEGSPEDNSGNNPENRPSEEH